MGCEAGVRARGISQISARRGGVAISVAMSRDRVISHLRQPEFEKKFIEDIPDPSQHATALRDFHSLLRTAGLG